MKKKIKYLIRDSLRLILGKYLYTKIRFFIVHKYLLDLKNPKTFSHKIIKRKFDSNSLQLSVLVDKYTVRKYVQETIGEEYLIPLVKVVDYLTPEDFEDLPDSFVIKTSNGGGGENVMIVEEKSSLNFEEVCSKFNNYLPIKIGKAIDEPFYDIEKPRIIIEKLVKHADGRFPSDYKIHIFKNNNNTKLFIQVDSDRFTNHKRSIYTEELALAPFNIQPKYEMVGADYKFPLNMEELLTLSKKLAQPFEYVRIDMYNVDGTIYFGEMTFCHGSGWEPIKPMSADHMLGSLWKEYN